MEKLLAAAGLRRVREAPFPRHPAVSSSRTAPFAGTVLPACSPCRDVSEIRSRQPTAPSDLSYRWRGSPLASDSERRGTRLCATSHVRADELERGGDAQVLNLKSITSPS